MAAREIIVKKYVVRLSGEEREQLAALTERTRPGAAADEGADFVEGGRLGSRRRMERQPNHRGPGDQRIHGLPGPQTTGGRRPRGCVESQATSGACRSQNLRWREGSQADCLGLFRTSQGPRTLDIAVVGKQGRGAEHHRSRQRQHNRADPQKNILKPHLKQQWVIPPKANSAFVAAMEDVLAVYTRPRDPDMPLVCLDETSKQLIAETRAPVQMKKGRPARFDYEYERKGTANLFMMFAPLEGWRHVKVTDRHTAVDYAHALKDLADIHFFNAKKIVLVQDNLNTHTKASLYEAFPAAEARRLAERFEWHYTPKHGSWLDMAESTRRPFVPVPRSPHPGQANPDRRNCSLGGRSQYQSRQGRLAVHHSQCSD